MSLIIGQTLVAVKSKTGYQSR